ncbi:hypothetical protein SHIRM173S_11242 [Streptomyces hirsutus]
MWEMWHITRGGVPARVSVAVEAVADGGVQPGARDQNVAGAFQRLSQCPGVEEGSRRYGAEKRP